MLSLSCKAAIKAVIYLGSKIEYSEKKRLKEIAACIQENEYTLGKLLQKLAKDGIIKSTKGPNGGFYMTEKQIDIPVIKIIEAIDGKDIFNHCGLGLSQCSPDHPCPFHHDFKPIRELFQKMCQEKKISDLYAPVNDGLAYLAAL